MKKIIILILSLLLLCTVVSCDKGEPEDIWENAMYTSDTELGEGAKTVRVEVKAEGKSVTFTIHTDENILGDALTAHGLVEGDDGQFGLYVKKVNGILADYDINGRYWSFTKNGQSLNFGIDGAEIRDGEKYELVYAK